MNDIFTPADQNTSVTRASLFTLSQPLPKINHGQKVFSCVSPSIWNKLTDYVNMLFLKNKFRRKMAHSCLAEEKNNLLT